MISAAILLAAPVGAETIAAAVRAAVTTNPALRATTSEARANAYDLLQLRSEYDPVVTLRGEIGKQIIDDPVSLSPEDNDTWKTPREIGLEAELVIFDGSRRANLVYSNAARVDAGIFRLLDASETMALNASEVYIDLYRHTLLLSAAQRNLARHRQIGESVTRLVESGRLPFSDKLQAEDRIRGSELVIIDVSRAIKDAEARFRRIVGRSRSGSLARPGVPVNVRSGRELADIAVANSFRVKIADIEIDRRKYERRAEEADYFPTFSLGAGVRRGMDLDGSEGDESDTYVGIRMNWIISQGGRKARSQAFVEREHQARSELHVAVRDTRELAERTWNSHVANATRATVLGIQLDLNREIITQYLAEFQAGTRSLLDLLDAERSAFETEFEKISADSSLIFSGYRILAMQALLARHFGVKPAGMPLDANFEARAIASPRSVFRTTIPPLAAPTDSSR